MNTKSIYPVSASDPENLTYSIIHPGMVVKRMYEQNLYGTLVPVEFTQQDSQVVLTSRSYGKLFVKYRKQ